MINDWSIRLLKIRRQRVYYAMKYWMCFSAELENIGMFASMIWHDAHDEDNELWRSLRRGMKLPKQRKKSQQKKNVAAILTAAAFLVHIVCLRDREKERDVAPVVGDLFREWMEIKWIHQLAKVERTTAAVEVSRATVAAASTSSTIERLPIYRTTGVRKALLSTVQLWHPLLFCFRNSLLHK